MKFHASTLALLSGTNAFLFQGPKSTTFQQAKQLSLTSLEAMGYDSNVGTGSPLQEDLDSFLNGGRRQSDVNTGLMSPDARMGEFNPFDNRKQEETSSSLMNQMDRGRERQESLAEQIWEKAQPVMVQGGSLKTWSFSSPLIERIHVVMKTEGRPLDTSVELWQGPNNTPVKLQVYTEDGSMRPFSAVLETPMAYPTTLALRNTAQIEFPFAAGAVANAFPEENAAKELYNSRNSITSIVQGGALRTFSFDAFVNSVQILLQTDGRPLNARIELLQGPNNNKQVVEVYADDGMDRPFYIVMETPGSGNVVRICNTATVEFPLTAWVEPYTIGNFDPYAIGGNDQSYLTPVIGGDGSFGSSFPLR